MKWMNFLATSAVAVTLLSACAHKTATSYTLTAELEGLPDGTPVQLIPLTTSQEKPFAETTVENGKFVLKGEIEEPRAMVLMVKNSYGSQRFMLENGEIKITGRVNANEMDGATNYDYSEMKITGSPATDKYLKLLSERDKLDVIYQENNKKFAAVSQAYGKARSTQNQAMMDSLLATDDYKAMSEASKAFFAEVEKTYHQVIMSNKDNYFGPLMMISLFSYINADQKEWYDEFSDEAKNSYYGKLVKEEVDPSTKVGSSVPAFSVTDQEGKETPFAELCQGKKYILIDFWASWCNPCRKEIPNLKKLYAKYSEKGFQIVSISIDKKKEDWTKALEEEKLQWPNFLDNGDIATLYKIKFVPTMYLVDAEGKMVAENLRGEEFAKKLAELFSE